MFVSSFPYSVGGPFPLSVSTNIPRGTLGFAMLRCCSVLLCGIPVNKIPHCGVAVISNPTVCDVCAFKLTVFGETKIICGVAIPAASIQFTCRPCAMDGIYDFVMCLQGCP